MLATIPEGAGAPVSVYAPVASVVVQFEGQPRTHIVPPTKALPVATSLITPWIVVEPVQPPLPEPLLDPELLPDPLLDPELLPDPLLDPEPLPDSLPSTGGSFAPPPQLRATHEKTTATPTRPMASTLPP
jgi:hypothetical protein